MLIRERNASRSQGNTSPSPLDSSEKISFCSRTTLHTGRGEILMNRRKKRIPPCPGVRQGGTGFSSEVFDYLRLTVAFSGRLCEEPPTRMV